MKKFKLKPIEAFKALIGRFMLSDQARRWKDKGPGKVVESLSPEMREALTQLKSDDINPKLRVEDYWMMGEEYQKKLDVLDLEKNLGVQLPPRKKYGDHE